MTKIVFIEHSFDGGGAEKVSAILMRSLCKEGHNVHLVLISDSGNLSFLIPEAVTVHRLGIEHTRNAPLKLVLKIREIKPDVVYSSLARTTILSIFARIFFAFKIVARYPSMPEMEKKDGSLKGWRYFLLKLFYKRVDILIAQTDEMKNELASCYAIDHSKIMVIHNPVDSEYLDSCVAEKKNPFSKDVLNIVSIGTVYNVKGYDILIQALKIVKEKRKDIVLYIIGSDYKGCMKDLMTLVENLELKENVKFTGFMKNPYIMLKYSDLFVLSSRREGLPNVILEAQYFGKPVIATRCVPVIERLIINGVNGYVVDVDDVPGLASAILDSDKLSPVPVYRDTIGEFINILGEK